MRLVMYDRVLVNMFYHTYKPCSLNTHRTYLVSYDSYTPIIGTRHMTQLHAEIKL